MKCAFRIPHINRNGILSFVTSTLSSVRHICHRLQSANATINCATQNESVCTVPSATTTFRFERKTPFTDTRRWIYCCIKDIMNKICKLFARSRRTNTFRYESKRIESNSLQDTADHRRQTKHTECLEIRQRCVCVCVPSATIDDQQAANGEKRVVVDARLCICPICMCGTFIVV